MKKAVIFDLDGTLLDTLCDICESVNQGLLHFGYKARTISEVRGFVGNGYDRLIELSLEGGKSNPQFASVLEYSKSYYAKHAQVKTKAYDGIIPLLSQLSKKGIKIGIVSNKPDAQVKYLASLYFKDFVSDGCAWGEDEEHGIKRKPAPDCVEQVLKTMGVQKEDAVYCGDSDVDIKTAAAANLECISVDWGFKTRTFLTEHKAKTIISRPMELLEHL